MGLGDKFLSIAERNGIDISDIDPKELTIGFDVELEHGSGEEDTNVTDDDILKTIKIAIAHLRENPKYYTLLKKYVEKDVETNNNMINENSRFKQLAGISTSEGKKALVSENFKDNIKEVIKEQINPSNQLTKFEVLPNGNLKISITEEGREYLEENKDNLGWRELISDLFEYNMANGYNYVQPEDIQALTSSLIISDTILDGESTQGDLDNANVWWFPEYQVVNEIDELEKNGFVIFTNSKEKEEEEEEEEVNEEMDLGFIQYKKDNDLEVGDEESEFYNQNTEDDEELFEIVDGDEDVIGDGEVDEDDIISTDEDDNDANDEEDNELQYFIDTFYNGQFSQLKELLFDIKSKNETKDLINYIDEFGGEKANEIKNWIIDNLI